MLSTTNWNSEHVIHCVNSYCTKVASMHYSDIPQGHVGVGAVNSGENKVSGSL